MKFNKFFRLVSMAALSISALSCFNENNVFAEAALKPYVVSKPLFNFDENKNLKCISNCQTKDSCTLTSAKDADGKINLNLSVQVKKYDSADEEKSLLFENMNQKLIAAIEFLPSSSTAWVSPENIKHQAEVKVADSNDPNYEKVLTASFVISLEQLAALKELNSDAKKRENSGLIVNFYKDEINITNLVASFELNSNEPSFEIK